MFFARGIRAGINFCAGAVCNVMLTDGLDVRDESGYPFIDRNIRQSFTFIYGVYELGHAIRHRDIEGISFSIGLLTMLALHQSTSCYNMDTGCGVSSSVR